MKKGKRYDNGAKLNVKKVIAVIMAFAVIIMFIVGIKTLLTKSEEKTATVVSSYYPVYTNEKWGVIDQTGKIIIEPTFSEMITIPSSKTDLFICMYDIDYTNNTYKTKVLDSKNQEKFTEYESVEAIENVDKNNILWYEKDVLKVKKDGKYGLIDYKGNVILNIEYDNIYALQGVENSLIIKKNENIGLCDNKGEIIIPTEYKKIEAINDDYKNGYIVVNNDNKYGVIDFTKTVIFEPQYQEIKGLTSNDIYIVKENNVLKAINKKQEVLLQDKFQDVKQINGDNIVFINNNKYGVINTNGEIKVKAEYDNLEYAFGEYYIAKKSDKYGIIDLNGNICVPFEYTNLSYRKGANIIEAQNGENVELTRILNDKFEEKLQGIICEINEDKGYMRMRVDDEYKYYNFKLEEQASTQVLSRKYIILK